MTVELMTKLLAAAEAHFGRPQTAESRASIAEIWARSPIKDTPDDIAEEAFYNVIWKCTWQSQLLKEWQEAIEKIEGEREMTRRCLIAHRKMQKMLKAKEERKLLESVSKEATQLRCGPEAARLEVGRCNGR